MVEAIQDELELIKSATNVLSSKESEEIKVPPRPIHQHRRLSSAAFSGKFK
jgi:hypothetical protein